MGGRRALLALSVTAMAANAQAAEDHVWVRAGATAATVSAADARCYQEGDSYRRYGLARFYFYPPPPAQGAAVPIMVPAGHVSTAAAAGAGAAGIAAILVIAALEAGPAARRAAKTYAHACMLREGYVWLSLSSGETADLAALSGEADRRAWMDRFLAGDLKQRIADASAAVTPPLPAGHAEPMVFNGLIFDPSAMTVAKGVVNEDGVLLTGTAAFAHTARLAQPIDLPKDWKAHAEAGSVFYQVVQMGAVDPAMTAWCGSFSVSNVFRSSQQVDCIAAGEQGYELGYAAGAPPYGAPPQFYGQAIRTKDVKVELTPSETPLLEPMKITFRLGFITDYVVTLRAYASDGRHKTQLWKINLTVDKDGVAVLPFWSSRLVLKRVPFSGFTATLSPDGDGKGWLDAKLAG